MGVSEEDIGMYLSSISIYHYYRISIKHPRVLILKSGKFYDNGQFISAIKLVKSTLTSHLKVTEGKDNAYLQALFIAIDVFPTFKLSALSNPFNWLRVYNQLKPVVTKLDELQSALIDALLQFIENVPFNPDADEHIKGTVYALKFLLLRLHSDLGVEGDIKELGLTILTNEQRLSHLFQVDKLIKRLDVKWKTALDRQQSLTAPTLFDMKSHPYHQAAPVKNGSPYAIR